MGAQVNVASGLRPERLPTALKGTGVEPLTRVGAHVDLESVSGRERLPTVLKGTGVRPLTRVGAQMPPERVTFVGAIAAVLLLADSVQARPHIIDLPGPEGQEC